MNKLARAVLVVVALLVALAASGCTDRVSGAPAAGDGQLPALPRKATETTTTPPQAATNERGFVPKKLGENACFAGMNSDSCDGGVVFSVDRIVVDPPCADFGQRTGHTLVVSMRVATGTDSEPIQFASGVFNPFSFIVIGMNGVSQKANFGMCTNVTDNPDTYGPNQKYAFSIELDVPVAHGSLVLQPGMVGESGSGGWEWPF